MLDLLAERSLVRETVHRARHPPGEPLRLPDAGKRLLRIGVEPGARLFDVEFAKRVKEIAHVARSEIQPLRSSGRHDMARIARQEQAPEAQRLRNEGAQR